jgi:deoxyribodipyrimidine photolyase
MSSQVVIEVPESVAGGHYADFASVWHTDDVFVFDFAALKAAPAQVETTEGQVVHVVQGQVVARVKMAPAQVWEVMKALNEQLAAWEAETGRTYGQPPPSG